MRVVLFVLLIFPSIGCGTRAGSRLPEAGSVYSDKASGNRYRVTWAGTTSYNQGACPEVGTLCVHLVDNVDQPLAPELAVPLEVFQAKYSQAKY